ncbi:hypothetical protein ONZ45_g5236 [Pleurotus djamor]|nr:hypothetical protein ONZ45_g5236 [Pleurotus djamor]
MRPTIFLVAALSVATAQASWFSNEQPEYSNWSTKELRKWLQEHHVDIPASTYSRDELELLVKSNWNTASAWTQDNYASAQRAFADIQETAFEKWDESKLREFLLEQGVVSPSGPREQLVLLAKQKYRAYTDTASSLSSMASASASTAVYGDTAYQASKSLSSIAAQATKQANRVLDDSTDYVYSTWDDNQLRTYLEEKGLIKTKAQKSRDEMLVMMRDAYSKVANPIWQAWSYVYQHSWLVDHNIVKSDYAQNRDALVDMMSKYYYDVNDSVWSTWSDSQLKSWLVENDIIKSDAQVKREKMMKLVEDNYANARSTIWSAWSDTQIRDWLIKNGYLRSDAQVKRDELVTMINDKYKDASARSAEYLTWPDARLRAYLRERGVNDEYLPGGRPSLLQEARIHWVQSTNRAENVYKHILEVINGAVATAEEKLAALASIITGYSSEKYHQGQKYADSAYDDASGKYDEAKRYGEEKWSEGRDAAGDKIKKGGEKVKGEL